MYVREHTKVNNLEALIELSKLSASRHDERRKYEWKVSLAFWALIIGAIVKKSDLRLQCINGWIGILAGGLYALLWLRGIWVANANDKSSSDHFRSEAVAILQNQTHLISAPPGKIKVRSLKFWFGFLLDWAMLFHLVVTVVLIALFFRIT
jgi:hypothetical protein